MTGKTLFLNIQLFAEGADGNEGGTNEVQNAECQAQSEMNEMVESDVLDDEASKFGMRNAECGIAGEWVKVSNLNPPVESAFLVTFCAPAKSNAPRRAEYNYEL